MKKKSIAFWALIGISAAVGITLFTQYVMPAVFGVTLTGLFAKIRSKLGAAGGGILGGFVGFLYEKFTAFSTIIIQPAMAGDPIAWFALSGVGAAFAVFLYNIGKYGKPWM